MHQRTKTIILYDFELFADCKADSRHPGFITPGLAWPGEELFYQTAQLVAIGAEAFRSAILQITQVPPLSGGLNHVVDQCRMGV